MSLETTRASVVGESVPDDSGEGYDSTELVITHAIGGGLNFVLSLCAVVSLLLFVTRRGDARDGRGGTTPRPVSVNDVGEVGSPSSPVASPRKSRRVQSLALKRKLGARAGKWYHLVAILFFASRTLWFGTTLVQVIDFSDLDLGVRAALAVNRLGSVMFFTMTTLVVFFWVIEYRKLVSFKAASSKAVARVSKRAFAIVNVLAWAVTALLVILWAVRAGGRKEGNTLYEASVLFVVLLTAVVGVLVVVFGSLLYARHREEAWHLGTEAREMRKIVWTTAIFVLGCCLKIACLLWRPIAARNVDPLLFYSLCYWVPESSSFALQLYVIHTSREPDAQDNRLIERLFDESKTPLVPPPRGGRRIAPCER